MKTAQKPQSIVNRRAAFDYFLGDEIVAGLALTGAETKAARNGHAQLKGSYVTINGGELWLINASFSVRTNDKGNQKTVDSRARKLLVKRRQINQLIEAKKQGLTIVPVKLLPSGRFIKLVIATARGKKRYDKREVIKKRDLKREQRKSL
ncbi:MAG: SsrA-binding protein SmpB [Candidatus Nomurabacteria bacterium]|jgi:SsrA-binding protein|nr:SsrA-binding protein SmpB [Candidatus Nomurabacteria bacterium]